MKKPVLRCGDRGYCAGPDPFHKVLFIMRYATLLYALIVLLLLTPRLPAEDPKFVSGPQVGQEIPGPIHAYNITGAKKNQDRFHCLICEYGADPVVVVFKKGSDFGEPFVKLLKGLDAAVVKHDRARLHAFGVVLDGELADVVKEDARREAVRPKVLQLDKAAGLNEGAHLPLALDSKGDLVPYKLHDDAEVTVLLYRDHKVVGNYAFKQLDDKAVDTILKEGLPKLVPTRK